MLEFTIDCMYSICWHDSNDAGSGHVNNGKA
jgi:hypothetical protein